MPTSNSNGALRAILTLAGVVLVTGFLYWARPVLVPLALAILLAFILTPPVNILQRRGLGRVPSVLVVVALSFGLVGGVGYFVGNQIVGLIRQLPRYQNEIASKVASLSGGGGGMLGTIEQTIRNVNQQVKDKESDQKVKDAEAAKQGGNGTAKKTENAAPAGEPAREPADGRAGADKGEKGQPQEKKVEPGTSPDYPLYTQVVSSGWGGITDYLGPAAEGFASSVLVVVMVVFMLIQRENLRNRLVRLIGHGQLIVTTRAIDEGARRISGFLLMQVCINAGFGVAVMLALLVLSFVARTPEDAATLRQYALLWGFVCGLMRFVPYIGTWVGAALLVAFSVATLNGWVLPLTIFAAFLVLELLCANAVEPLLFGHSTGSSPLALLLSAAFWAWLWGPMGLLLSTPMTVVLVVVGKYVPQLRFLEVLLGDEPVLGRHVVLYQRLVARDQDEAADLVDEYLREHSVEETYQDLLLPALALARQDLDRDELDPESAHGLYRMVRELVDDVAPPPAAAPGEGAAHRTMVLGCPARDEVDELTLAMFGHLMQAQGRPVEIVSSKMLTAEVLGKVGETCPGVVVIASVPPGGLAQSRYLCKRMKSQCSGIKVVVGRWGRQDDADRVRERLKDSGADAVGSTLAETRAEVISLARVAEAAAGPKPARAEGELVAT